MSFLRKTLMIMAALTISASAAQATVHLPKDPNASPPSTIKQSLTVPLAPEVNKQFNHEKKYGNSYWGARFRIYEHPRAQSTLLAHNAHYEAWGKLFKKELSALAVASAAWDDQAKNKRATHVWILVAGKKVFDERADKSGNEMAVTSYDKSLDKNILSGSMSYPLIYGISVSVKGTIQGHLSVGYGLVAVKKQIIQNGYADAYLRGKMSAGLDAYIGSAGIRGTITFIQFKPKKTMTLVRKTSNTVQYGNQLGLQLSSLQGFLEVYASFLGMDVDKVIFDWSGYTYDKTFFNINKTYTL